MSNEQDLVPSVLGLPDHLAAYVVPATPADLHNNGNEIVECSICYFEFSPSPADKETTTANTTTTTATTTTAAPAPMEQAEPCLPPVKLVRCGHIFCRVCVLVHLNGHRHGPDAPPCPMCRQPCYPQTAIPEDTLSDVEVDLDDLEALSDFEVEGVGEGEEGEEEDRGDILAFIGEDTYGPAETGERREEIEEEEESVEEEMVEEDEEMRDYEWEDEDDEDDEEDGDFEPMEEEEVEEEYEEDDEKVDLMELWE